MSELPQIDPKKVAQKLISKNGDLTYQVTTLEVLAEALRDERDEAVNRVAELEEELARRNEPVADISSLPAK